ncbi:MAG: branched-chain amino acid ABC transporter permease [Deltaproteobacteria bacterium]|nr:branched-chain amino acid ABC transporter permease [Deltaproteobacteria bacterium]
MLQEVLQYFFSGVTNGAIYAVIALGFTMLFGTTGLINFAQGEFVMLGALGLITLWKGLDLPLWLAFVLSTAGVAATGLLLERLAIRTVRKPHPIVLVIITIGASILLKGIAMLAWGKDARSAPPFSRHPPLEVAGATLLSQSIWIIVIVVLVVLALQAFYRKSLTGKAMQACAINQKAALLIGIPSERMTLLAFALSAGMGGIGGILVAPVTMSSYDMGMLLGLKGFCAAMLGGLGSSWGAVLGGMLLGILEALGVGLFSSSLKDAIAFFLLLGILYLRPSGILGEKAVHRF